MPQQTSSRPARATVTLVKRAVRSLLDASPAYGELPPESQRRLADGMVRIGSYLAEPEGFPANDLPGALTAVPPRRSGRRAGETIEAVNFPEFVSGLIEGVFRAIVDGSIQQLKAYGDLVESVAATVDEFTKTGASDSDARDWLAANYGAYLECDPKSGGLRPRPGLDSSGAMQRLRWLPLEHALERLGPEEIKKKLIPAARRRIAATRQQLIATMVLSGINRIVVTDGRIEAKLRSMLSTG